MDIRALGFEMFKSKNLEWCPWNNLPLKEEEPLSFFKGGILERIK